MKSLTETLKESIGVNEGLNWLVMPDIDGNPYAESNITFAKGTKWLQINIDDETIGGVTESMLSSFDIEGLDKDLMKMKVGQTMSPDGGTNIYIRISK